MSCRQKLHVKKGLHLLISSTSYSDNLVISLPSLLAFAFCWQTSVDTSRSTSYLSFNVFTLPMHLQAKFMGGFPLLSFKLVDGFAEEGQQAMTREELTVNRKMQDRSSLLVSNFDLRPCPRRSSTASSEYLKPALPKSIVVLEGRYCARKSDTSSQHPHCSLRREALTVSVAALSFGQPLVILV